MLPRIVEVVLLFSFSSILHAGDPVYSRFGAGEAGMAYACVSSQGHWNSFHNQALLPYCHNFSVGSSVETRFMMTDFSLKALSFILPGKPAPLGILMTHYGNRQYSLLTGGLGSAVILTPGVSAGVQVDLINEHCAGTYSDRTLVTFEAGMFYQLSQDIAMGLHVFNPLMKANRLPSSLRAGLSWTPDKSLLMAIELIKVTDEPLSVRTGVAWRIPQGVALRAGYGTNPSSFAFGTGYSSERFSYDAGFIINNDTGVTPSVSFLWKISGK